LLIFGHPTYNHFQVFVDLLDLIVFDGKVGDWFHHCIDDKIIKMNQNEDSAISQFIGDRWGIIKSPKAIKSWQDFVIY